MSKTIGLEGITIGELIDLSKILDMPISKARSKHKEWMKKHDLTDRQAINALEISKKIVNY